MSLITRKLMEMLPLLKRASLPEESRAVAVAIVDSNITLIRHMEADGKTGNADAANHRARLFYLLIGVLWQTLKPHLDQAKLPPAHGTLSPFEGMLRNSGFSELWSDTDVKHSIDDLVRLARAKDTTSTASSLR
ncbi:MAG: hypothetical protein JNJ83_19025 [Verrucomicrobiaceae bacterium]|nr:hypothetical protein [Verrucomicrobiaceae bacterium]